MLQILYKTACRWELFTCYKSGVMIVLFTDTAS